MEMASKQLMRKVAIITGSSSGIGRAVALEFHRQGAMVVCADTKETMDHVTNTATGSEDSLPTHKLIGADGGHAIFVKTDVTVAIEVQNLVKVAVEKFGRIDM
jgi:NAD(P)-dependent dehydrogenase (short-subunit alcohol dehydrogenase family)